MPDIPHHLERAVITAAEQADRLAFAAAAARIGSLAGAQTVVRSRGIFRMADRSTATRTVNVGPAVEIRSTADGADGPTMFGHFAVFNDWTEIDSFFEGNFLERIAPGAFEKTFEENLGEMRSLFQHGFDPQIGDKPLGPIADVREDEIGAYYEVPLLDAGYVRKDILPGLEAGLYGASFRFQMMREEFNTDPGTSAANPKGLPERTLKELRVFEFGPVTFPAYPAASAAVRSTEESDPDQPEEGEEGSTTAPAEEDADNRGIHPTLTGGAGTRSHLPGARRGTPYNLPRKEAPSWVL